MKILGTGLSGMVGSYVVEKLSSQYEFENLSLETGVDITNAETVDQYLSKTEASWILHFAAKTDVDGAEKEKELAEKSPTWIVNVGATKILVDACKKYKKKLLYISTDFVFPGGDKIYTEEDVPEPIGWYAQTKYLGEKEVATLGDQGLIVRISFPYGVTGGPRPDFVGRLIQLMKEGKQITSPVDQLFVPTHIDTITDGIQVLLEQNAFGIYHVVGPAGISSYESSCMIADVFGFDSSKIQKTTASDFYHGRAPRAFHLVISNAKITGLGIKALDFKSGLLRLKEHLL